MSKQGTIKGIMNRKGCDARQLTDMLHQLLNRFHFLKSDKIPPEPEFSFRELRIIYFLGIKRTCTMSELAEAFGIPLSTATGIIDRLVVKGLVARIRLEEDRRVVKIELTVKGQDVFDWDFEEHVQFIRHILKHLDEKDQIAFQELLQKILGNLVSLDKEIRST